MFLVFYTQRAFLLHATLLFILGHAQSSCSNALTPTNSIKPSVASGYRAALVATGLTSPRSIQFDGSGNLLVLEQSVGLTSLRLEDHGGTCVGVELQKMVLEAANVTSISPTQGCADADLGCSSPTAWLYHGTERHSMHHRLRQLTLGLIIRQTPLPRISIRR